MSQSSGARFNGVSITRTAGRLHAASLFLNSQAHVRGFRRAAMGRGRSTMQSRMQSRPSGPCQETLPFWQGDLPDESTEAVRQTPSSTEPASVHAPRLDPSAVAPASVRDNRILHSTLGDGVQDAAGEMPQRVTESSLLQALGILRRLDARQRDRIGPTAETPASERRARSESSDEGSGEAPGAPCPEGPAEPAPDRSCGSQGGS